MLSYNLRFDWRGWGGETRRTSTWMKTMEVPGNSAALNCLAVVGMNWLPATARSLMLGFQKGAPLLEGGNSLLHESGRARIPRSRGGGELACGVLEYLLPLLLLPYLPKC